MGRSNIWLPYRVGGGVQILIVSGGGGFVRAARYHFEQTRRNRKPEFVLYGRRERGQTSERVKDEKRQQSLAGSL